MQQLIQALFVALLFGAQLSTPALAQEETDPYTEAVRIGVDEFSRGNFAESLAAMRRAHDIDPNARTLRGMGLTTFEMRDYVSALDYLERSLTNERKPLTPQMREKVKAVIRRAEANVATVILRVTPSRAKVRVDEGPAEPLKDDGVLRLNLGTHILELRAEGRESQRLRLELAGGEEPVLEVTLPATRPPVPAVGGRERDPKRIWGQVLIAMASGALVGTVVSAGLRKPAVDKYNSDECGPIRSEVCPDEGRRADATLVAAAVLGAAAGVLGISGAALLWTSKRRAKKARAASMSALRCTAGIGVACELKF